MTRPAGGGWLLAGLQCLGALHLPTCLPPRDRSGEHPETVIPLSALPRRERECWARLEEQVR